MSKLADILRLKWDRPFGDHRWRFRGTLGGFPRAIVGDSLFQLLRTAVLMARGVA